MRVRPVLTPSVGWTVAPFAFVVLTSCLSAYGSYIRPVQTAENAATLGESITTALSNGDEEAALKAWQGLRDPSVNPGAEGAQSTTENALLQAGRAMALRGGDWRMRCRILAQSISRDASASERSKEVAKRLLRLTTSNGQMPPRTVAAIASASMP